MQLGGPVTEKMCKETQTDAPSQERMTREKALQSSQPLPARQPLEPEEGLCCHLVDPEGVCRRGHPVHPLQKVGECLAV